MDRMAEILCGLIMVMTFTTTVNQSQSSREDLRTILLAALGCNLAWGIIDGALYVMACVSERGKRYLSWRTVHDDPDVAKAHGVIREVLPPAIASVLSTTEFEQLRQRLRDLPEPPVQAGASREDWLGGLGVLLLVFLSTFPVVIPFIFMSDVRLALRISNLIAVALMFLTGYFYGRATGIRPWRTGVITLLVGALLAVVALVLGG